MLARIRDNAWLYLEQVTPEFDLVIADYFSVEHPRRRFIDTEQYGWDGKIRRYDYQRQRLALPFLDDLASLCTKHDIPLDVVDERPEREPPKHEVHEHMLGGVNVDGTQFTLEAHQMEAINACIANDVGIINIPTGGGKTEIMAGVTKAYSLPTVIIAEQRIVIEQIKERLELRDVVNDGDKGSKVGLFYGGSTPSGQMVVVGSIQSLSNPPTSLKLRSPAIYKKRKLRAKLFQEIVGKAGLLLVDECDRATTDQYKHLFRTFYKGRLKFGFSGTPFDKKKPVQDLMLREYLGSIVATCTRQELEAIGRIIPIKVAMLGIGAYSKATDKIAFDVAEREQIIENADFHKMVIKIVNQFKDEGTLILVDTSNVEELGIILEHKIPGSKFIFGKTSKKQRKEILQSFEKRELKCLIGGKILKRGLDLKGGVDNLIVIGGGKLWSNIDQSLGRAVRNNTRGFARAFGFLFMGNKYLYDHGKEQLKAIMHMGYETNVLVSNKLLNGKDFIKSYRRS